MVNKNESIQVEIDKALSHFKNTDYKESIKILRNLEKKNSHFLIYWYLGHSYFRIYDYLLAIECIEKSIELKKPDTLNLNFLADIFLKTNNHEKATKLFKEALDIDNKNIKSLFGLAKIYVEIGEIDKAEEYYNRVIKEEPTNLEAWYELIKIDRKYITDDLIKKLEKKEILNNKNIFNDIFSPLILAEKCKFNKNYKSELNNLLLAHDSYLEKKKKSIKQEFNYYTNLLPQFISKINNTNIQIHSDLKPIFIMGLPRSGTTLIESIISSNDQINQGGEIGAINKVFYKENLITNYDSEILNTHFSFDKDSFQNLQESILDQYNQSGINLLNGFFTDKSLENFLYIDLIYKIFPKAKFIYCKRNKFANLIGILKVFLPGLLWTHSISKIISIINLYDNKLRNIISEKKIKLKIVEIENFSNNPEEISEHLFEFLGIKSDKKILDKFFNNKKIIQTVSNLQVRKKISKHNLDYLNNYLPHLEKHEIKKLN